jgi:hypothetical protein
MKTRTLCYREVSAFAQIERELTSIDIHGNRTGEAIAQLKQLN